MPITSSVQVRTITLDTLGVALRELRFIALGDEERAAIPGPLVYVLADPDRRIHYIGKSDAQGHNDAQRALLYEVLGRKYRLALSEQGGADTVTGFATADLAVAARFAPIVRYAHLHDLRPYVAGTSATGLSGSVWEARVQALSGILTGNESLIGGSAWEANDGTLRGDGYDWSWRRLWELRDEGTL